VSRWLGGEFINAKKLDGGHKKKKNSKTKNEIRVEKGKRIKFNLSTTLLNTMKDKNHISAPKCIHGC